VPSRRLIKLYQAENWYIPKEGILQTPKMKKYRVNVKLQFHFRKLTGSRKKVRILFLCIPAEQNTERKKPTLGSYRRLGMILNFWHFRTKFNSLPTF
jgi:hypothetical protein